MTTESASTGFKSVNEINGDLNWTVEEPGLLPPDKFTFGNAILLSFFNKNESKIVVNIVWDKYNYDS